MISDMDDVAKAFLYAIQPDAPPIVRASALVAIGQCMQQASDILATPEITLEERGRVAESVGHMQRIIRTLLTAPTVYSPRSAQTAIVAEATRMLNDPSTTKAERTHLGEVVAYATQHKANPRA